MSRVWREIAYGTQAFVDTNNEILETVSEGWRGVARWGERSFLTMDDAKVAVERAYHPAAPTLEGKP